MLDSKKIKGELESFLQRENRFNILVRKVRWTAAAGRGGVVCGACCCWQWHGSLLCCADKLLPAARHGRSPMPGMSLSGLCRRCDLPRPHLAGP